MGYSIFNHQATKTRTVTGAAISISLALAVKADDNTGVCFPGMEFLGQVANVTPDNARRAVRELEREGLWIVAQGSGAHVSSVYIYVPLWLSAEHVGDLARILIERRIRKSEIERVMAALVERIKNTPQEAAVSDEQDDLEKWDAMLAKVGELENTGDSACDWSNDGDAEPMHTGRKTHAQNGETHAHRPQNPGTGAGGIPVIQEGHQEYQPPHSPSSQAKRDAEAVERFKADFPPGTVGVGKKMRKGDRTPHQEDLDSPLVAAVFDALDGLDDVPRGLITHTADERRVCSEKIVRRFSEVTPEQIEWGVRLWGVTNWREGATTLYSKGVPAEIAQSIATIVAAMGRGEDPVQVVRAEQEKARNGGKNGSWKTANAGAGSGGIAGADDAATQQRVERERRRAREIAASGAG